MIRKSIRVYNAMFGLAQGRRMDMGPWAPTSCSRSAGRPWCNVSTAGSKNGPIRLYYFNVGDIDAAPNASAMAAARSCMARSKAGRRLDRPGRRSAGRAFALVGLRK